jgi:hypothetical protein
VSKICSIVALLVSCIFLLAGSAGATPQMNFDTVYSGTPPVGNSPWLTATFTDVTGGVVLNLSLSGLTSPAEFVTEWDFNFNPDKNVKQLHFDLQSGVSAKKIDLQDDAFKAGSSGMYDISIIFDSRNSNRLSAGMSVQYLITGPSVLASDFFFQSSSDTFVSAAHVQGYGSSAWIADPPPPQHRVPEPSTLVLLCSGLVGFIAFMKRSRKM